jgi:late competence protein required for DNA uptake (superfamily II DNA/RNA helicase)
MTRYEQLDALELFREGDFKIIVATTIAEEGLDVQECNLVVRYDYAGSPISLVQARGASFKSVVFNQSFVYFYTLFFFLRNIADFLGRRNCFVK